MKFCQKCVKVSHLVTDYQMIIKKAVMIDKINNQRIDSRFKR